MKKIIVNLFGLLLISFFVLGLESFKIHSTKNTETLVVEGKYFNPNAEIRVPVRAYILQAPAPGDSMPVKKCTGIGKDCNREASASLTQVEWNTYFPNVIKARDFANVDPHSNPEFINYLHGIGFGM